MPVSGACSLAPYRRSESIRKLAADLAGFDWGRDEDYRDRLYIPGLRRLGDVPTAVALAAPDAAAATRDR